LSYLGSLVENKQWIVGGYFNMIFTLEEKRGGKKMPGTRQHKIPGANIKTQYCRHRK
jgi:hypothetical protein